jgi:hypothetical protein
MRRDMRHHEVRLYACRYAKLYVVHMGCLGDARGNARGILKPNFKKSCFRLVFTVTFF